MIRLKRILNLLLLFRVIKDHPDLKDLQVNLDPVDPLVFLVKMDNK